MAFQDPVTDELLNISGLNLARRKAELAFEEAKMHEQVNARTSVPKVMAQLQEMQMKAAKQQEQIAKKQESQGMSQGAMLPPMTDVSGQTTGRSGQAGLSAASEIAQAVSGGSAIKQNQVISWGAANTPPPQANVGQPGVPQQGAPAPAAGMLSVPASTPLTEAIAQAKAAGAGGNITISQQVPISDDPLAKRIFRGVLNVVGGRAGFGGLGSTILPAPGEATVVTRIPGPEEEAQRLEEQARQEAKPLAVLLREGQGAVGTKRAGEVGKQIVGSLKDITDRHGDEVTKHAVQLASIEVMAQEQEDRAAMERAQTRAGISAAAARDRLLMREGIKAGDPSEQIKDKVAQINLQGGPKTPQEQAIVDSYAKTDPLQIKINEAIRGAGSPLQSPQPAPAAAPPNQAQVDAAYQQLTQVLGREPTGDEIKAFIARTQK